MHDYSWIHISLKILYAYYTCDSLLCCLYIGICTKDKMTLVYFIIDICWNWSNVLSRYDRDLDISVPRHSDVVMIILLKYE